MRSKNIKGKGRGKTNRRIFHTHIQSPTLLTRHHLEANLKISFTCPTVARNRSSNKQTRNLKKEKKRNAGKKRKKRRNLYDPVLLLATDHPEQTPSHHPSISISINFFFFPSN